MSRTRTLNFSSKYFGDKHVEALSAALETSSSNTSILRLDMSRNDVTCIERLSHALTNSRFRFLKHLDLSHNSSLGNSLTNLSMCLSNARHLVSLKLRDTGMTGSIISTLVDSLLFRFQHRQPSRRNRRSSVSTQVRNKKLVGRRGSLIGNKNSNRTVAKRGSLVVLDKRRPSSSRQLNSSTRQTRHQKRPLTSLRSQGGLLTQDDGMISLRHLDISDNNLSGKRASSAIARLLKHSNCVLESLHIRNTKLADDIQFVLEAAAKAPKLCRLNIALNSIKDLKTLTSSTSLKILDLTCADFHVDDLTHLLQGSRELQQVILSGKNVSVKSCGTVSRELTCLHEKIFVSRYDTSVIDWHTSSMDIFDENKFAKTDVHVVIEGSTKVRARVWKYEKDRMVWYDEIVLRHVRDPSQREAYLKKVMSYKHHAARVIQACVFRNFVLRTAAEKFPLKSYDFEMSEDQILCMLRYW